MNVCNKNREECSGCGMCSMLCPTSAITMTQDNEGFLYPIVDDSKCIDCSICSKRCPMVSPEINNNQLYRVGRIKDKDTLGNSASGGMFTAISDEVLLHKGIVFGAVFNNNFTVYHTSATSREERNKMRDSKYSQSNIIDSFQGVQTALSDNRMVLFSGTPCQCAAIKEYIKNKKINDNNLILVDLICHGVGSPLIWNMYLAYIKQKYKINIISNIRIRNKRYGTGYNMTIQGDVCYHKRGISDPYICLFGKNLILRPSCYNCPFKSVHRVGDITIGDFQKKASYPEYNDEKGVSTVIINTPKGVSFLDTLKNSIVLTSSDINNILQVNLHKQIPIPSERRSFFYLVENGQYKKALYLYTEEGFFNKVKGLIKRTIRKLY